MTTLRRGAAWLRALLVGEPRADRIGLVAEFRDAHALLHAIETLRGQGVHYLDAYVPYPVEGLSEALGLKRSRIAWLVGLFGFTAAALAYVLLWWINVVDFPRDVGGRPLHSAPAFIPFTFEIGILVGGTAAFVAFFLAGGMPRLWDPVFEVEGFESASVDGYWIGVDRRDVYYDESALQRALWKLGASRVSVLGEDGRPREGEAPERQS